MLLDLVLDLVLGLVYIPLAAWGKHAEIEGSHESLAVPFADVADIFKTFQDTILLIDKGEKTAEVHWDTKPYEQPSLRIFKVCLGREPEQITDSNVRC